MIRRVLDVGSTPPPDDCTQYAIELDEALNSRNAKLAQKPDKLKNVQNEKKIKKQQKNSLKILETTKKDLETESKFLNSLIDIMTNKIKTPDQIRKILNEKKSLIENRIKNLDPNNPQIEIEQNYLESVDAAILKMQNVCPDGGCSTKFDRREVRLNRNKDKAVEAYNSKKGEIFATQIRLAFAEFEFKKLNDETKALKDKIDLLNYVIKQEC